MNDEQKQQQEAGKARQVAMMADLLRNRYFASNASTADGRFIDVAKIVVDLVDRLVEEAILRMPEKDADERAAEAPATP